MTRERWQPIKAIFDEAVELAAKDRQPFLSAACAGDAELRAEVDSLLRSR